MERQMDLETPERLLIEKAANGDRAAFDRLTEGHRERLGALVAARLGNDLRRKVGVDDIVQDTFLRAFQSVHRFRWEGPDSVSRWLAAIADHVILYAAQKYRRDGAPLVGEPACQNPSPSKASRREERFDRLRDAIENLSEEHREVILLARIEGLRIKEIAVRMQRSEDAVKQLLARALRKLKTSFGDTESLHLPPRRITRTDYGND